MNDIRKWQLDFFARPAVYITVDSEGNLSAVYESEEAAKLEVTKYPRHRVIREHIHSLDLARRRWQP